MDVHQTICTVDIAGYGSGDRTRPNLGALRAGMYESMEKAFAESGIPWDRCFRQDVGDSILALVPAEVPKTTIASRLPKALHAALCAHNEGRLPDERVRLRLALHAGEITYDDRGVTATAIIEASRLLDAPPLKRALANSPGPLAVIASEWFYREVIRHDPDHEPDTYRRVAVDVKEFSGFGWIHLPGHELPPEPVAARSPATEAVVVEDVTPARAVLRPVLPRPSSPQFFEVVAAIEDIPCMRNEYTRALVVEELPFAGMIRYFPARRQHVTSILRTCLDFPNGVVELVTAMSHHESSDSGPLQRLLTLLTGGEL